MKKIILVLGICSVIIACNSVDKSGSATDTTSAGENTSASAQQPNADTNVNKIGTDSPASSGSGNGEELIGKSDCLTCHKVDMKLLGPAYQDVAAKYEATDDNIEMLAKKIIEGGGGVWGDIPMSPHPAVSTEDAKTMVKYILSLKTK
jgi:cytochrome c